jgi:predicted AAA+ superfamily ATPase
MLKEVYLVFTIRPRQQNVIRAIKKEPKLYFYHWSILNVPGARFENMTAVTLLRMAFRSIRGALLFHHIRMKAGIVRRRFPKISGRPTRVPLFSRNEPRG